MGIEDLWSAVKHNKDLAKEYRRGELEEKASNDKKLGWGIYNQSIIGFGENFIWCVPEEYRGLGRGEGLKKYIQDTLVVDKAKGPITGVEFGGPGENLFASFNSGFFDKTLGVTLVNPGIPTIKSNHEILEADILNIRDRELYNKLRSILGVEKVNLIISRMIGPLNDINLNPVIMDVILRNWYKMLAENGLMFVQFGFANTEGERYKEVEKWVKAVKARYPGIDIVLEPYEEAIRIHKKAGSPDELPPARELLDIN
jgi:hypothetical protein